MENKINNENYELKEVVLPKREKDEQYREGNGMVSASFRGYSEEIEKLEKHIKNTKDGYRLESISDIIDQISLVTGISEFADYVKEFPCLKAIGLAMNFTYSSVFAVYSESGYGYVTDCINKGFVSRETDSTWLYGANPAKDYKVRDYVTPFAYTFPFKKVWKDSNYYFKKDDKVFLIHSKNNEKISTINKTDEKKTDIAIDLDKLWEFRDNGDGTVAIARYKGDESNVSIPETKDEKRVTAILVKAFAKNENVKSVHIPDGVLEIGNGAFRSCENLSFITLPKNVKRIGNYAFVNCKSLASITIPEGVTKINKKTFGWCSNLETINIPDSVTEIRDGAFESCLKLKTIVIPDSVTKIGDGAFFDCEKLKDVDISRNITKIDIGAFERCESLTTITIPEGVVEIGEGAFCDCFKLSSITLPNSLKIIGEVAFGDCNKIVSVIIPDGVIEIGGSAFSGCDKLKSVTMSDSVKKIGNDAFEWCEKNPHTVITAPAGSYAIEYAKENNIKYKEV